MSQKSELEKTNFRYNLITALVYVVGIVLLVQLFNLQIIHGDEYRETSNTRLSRKAKIEAARGDIVDSSGNVLATTEMGFSLELYKTKVDNSVLNNAILIITTVLEKNGDTYPNPFPISINPFTFNFNSEEELQAWKKKYGIEKDASAEEAFYVFKDKYGIESENPDEIRKILAIRYTITTTGYSTTKSIKLSTNISRASSIELSERSNELPGMNITVEPIRKYTMGSLASHIVGYVGRISKQELEANSDYKYANDDYIGKSGVEYVFEKYLRGEDGEKQIDMSVDGQVTGEYVTKEAIGGSSIVLTIDANLQAITEESLRNNIEKIRNGGFSKAYDAQGGSVIVMNVKTGEILSLVSYPDYEPAQFINGISTEKWNEYKENNSLFNRSIQGAYAPGSIFKMVTAIAGLEEEAITTDERIYDTGIYPLYHKPVCWYYTDYHTGHGSLNVSGAIQKSCNYFFYEVGNRIGIDKLVEYAKYFGLGSKTGVELPNETAGELASREVAERKDPEHGWSDGSTLSAAIGQSYNNFSPVQIAKYVSMIANGGHKINPTIVKSVISSIGIQESNSKVKQDINERLGIVQDDSTDKEINPEYIEAVLEGMKATTELGGTAYNIFKDFDIEVGGKTGSAEAGNWTNAWFVGFAPFDDPEIAVVVLVENGGHGNYTAEVVRDIIQEYYGMNAEEIVEDMTVSSEIELFR